MKKLVIFAVATLWSINIINAQKLDFKYWDETGEYAYAHKIILPTLNNLTTLADMSQSKFISLMKEYGYFEDKKKESIPPFDYTFVVYYNWSLDFFMAPLKGLGTNTIQQSEIRRCAVIYGAINNLSPRDALTNLAKELQPYYIGQRNGKDCFVIKLEQGDGYVITIGSADGYYSVQCNHLDK